LTFPEDRAGRTFTIALTSDADALLAKLTALADLPPPSAVRLRDDRCDQIEPLQRVLADTFEVRAGTQRVALTFVSCNVSPAVDATVIYRGVLEYATQPLTVRTSLIYGSYALAVHRPGERTDTIQWLNGNEESRPMGLARAAGGASWIQRVVRDVLLGYSHIVPGGVDHILFVLGLFLLNQRLRPILVQVSAFTVAHSITLGLALYGIVSVRSSVVEPLIALSIVYVACENLMTSTLRPWRVGLVFAFGLLHGMGFADALAKLNLARSEFLSTLLSFNVGVEAGQLTVLACATLAIRTVALPPARQHALIAKPASITIAIVGALWVIQRLAV
jgi:hypothetical protein